MKSLFAFVVVCAVCFAGDVSGFASDNSEVEKAKAEGVKVEGAKVEVAKASSRELANATPVESATPIATAVVESSSVRTLSHAKILEISNRIDQLVQNQLENKSSKLNELSSDDVFLRRSYLDIVGRIPTIAETKDFLKSKSKTKRADLIDELLDSYGYVSRQFNFWADLLRIKSRLPGQLTGISYVDYVKDSLEANVAYDQFVRELIAAQGPNLKAGNGAVGYYLRDRNMPEDNMSNTVRIFLGTRLECAQCHDHPFDKWTQRQYFEMVAFTGGINYRARENESTFKAMRALTKDKSIPEKQRPLINRLSQTISHGITGTGTGLARLPEGFLGEDGYEGEIVIGKTMFEQKPLVDAKIPKAPKKKKKKRKNVQQAAIPGARQLGSREAYADWLTSPDNPRFATVIANRLWKQAMGLGLIEPVDIIEDGTVASNPELMNFLTETMIELGFDTKQFLRAIYNSQTYQASAYRSDITDPQEFDFNGPLVRRMSAEQLWDSLLVLTVPTTDERRDQVDGYRYGSLSNNPYEAYEKLRQMDTAEIKKTLAMLADRSKNRKKNSYKDDPEYKKMISQRKKLAKQLQAARRKKNVKSERELMIKMAALTTEFRKKGRGSGNYIRASELTSPANPGHFLREFGQSDREQIDNSNTDPAVTQVLSMMNGYVETNIAKDASSVLMQTALKSTSGEECTEAMFLSMLNRKPTPNESRTWKRDFKSARGDKAKIKEVYTDLIWTLANSNEFIFVK
jgi:uncharacterized protein (DUF1330 family)